MIAITNNSCPDITQAIKFSPQELFSVAARFIEKSENENLRRLLYDYPETIKCTNGNTSTLLHYACEHAKKDAVKILLENDSDVDAKTDSQQTALFAAAYSGCLDCVELLVTAGAQLNVVDSRGNNVLHVASCCQHFVLVKLFLKLGVDWRKKSEEGLTPLQIASKCENPSMVRFFLEKRAYTIQECFLARAFTITSGKTAVAELLTQLLTDETEETLDFDYISQISCTDLGAKEKELLQKISWKSAECLGIFFRVFENKRPLTERHVLPCGLQNRCSEWLQKGHFCTTVRATCRKTPPSFFYDFFKTKPGKKISITILSLFEDPRLCQVFIKKFEYNKELFEQLQRIAAEAHKLLKEMLSRGNTLAECYLLLLSQIVSFLTVLVVIGTCRGMITSEILSHLYKEKTGQMLAYINRDFFILYDQLKHSGLHFKKKHFHSTLKPLKHFVDGNQKCDLSTFDFKKIINSIAVNDQNTLEEPLKKAIFDIRNRAIQFEVIYGKVGHSIGVLFDSKDQTCTLVEPQFEAMFAYKNRQELFEDLSRYFAVSFPDLAVKEQLSIGGLELLGIIVFRPNDATTKV